VRGVLSIRYVSIPHDTGDRPLKPYYSCIMYKSFVQPVLEYACPVWCSAKDTVLRSLDPVHYAALRAVTGARWTTSREALDVYCGVWPLDMRREFLCTVTMLRIMRLDAAVHPLAASFVKWNNHVRQDRRSFFHLATSFLQVHRRHRKIDDGGIAFAERIPEEIEQPWTSRLPLTELPTREVAVASHAALFNERKYREIFVYIFVYTDGSCVENPGRAGIGVLCCTPTCSFTISERVGIASILTAELCAISRALLFLESSCDELLRRQVPVNICVDNVTALRVSKGVWAHHQNWTLVQQIHDRVASLVRSSITVRWHWTPSHQEIHGNEYLAKRAAFSVLHRRPRFLPPHAPNAYLQPQIPLSVSKSLTRTAISNRQRERWYHSFANHLGEDHLSRVQLTLKFNPRFTTGDRFTQTTLAQLRFGHSDLRAHQARFDNSTPMCACGTALETTAHYLLHCPLFDSQRYFLEQKLERILPSDVQISELLLLGGTEHPLSPQLYEKVSHVLGKFIRATRRFDGK